MEWTTRELPAGARPPRRQEQDIAGIRILVVRASGEPPWRPLAGLQQAGTVLSWTTGVRDVLVNFRPHTADLVLLRLSPPEFDGWQIVRALRAQADIPLVVVGADDDECHAAYLEAGADAYVRDIAPPTLLVAQIQAVLRRAGTRAQSPEREETYDDGFLGLDLRRRQVAVAGKVVDLAPKEYELLRHLFLHQGETQTYEQILLNVWDLTCLDRPHYVHTYIGYLRRKLEPEPAEPRYLRTVHGVGYQFVATPTADSDQ